MMIATAEPRFGLPHTFILTFFFPGMIATAEPAVITSNMDLLIRTGLTERGLSDFQLVHDACVALCKIAAAKRSQNDTPLKFDDEHEVFTSIREILTKGMNDTSSNYYVPMAQKALMVIYQFAERPDVLAGNILKELCVQVAEEKPKTILVQRLISVVGHLSVCQLNHLDVSILSELKRRKALRDAKKESKKEKNRRRSVRRLWGKPKGAV